MQAALARSSDDIGETPLPAGLDLDAYDKSKLVDREGRAFRDVRRALSPRYAHVWMHILAGHAVLVATAAAAFFVDLHLGLAGLALVPVGAFVIGYTVAYIQNFFHEAAHFNIAKSRKLNDLLANLLIGSLVGQDIRFYRAIHFDHHRYLGTINDTETSYFDALTGRFILESLTGIRVLRVLSGRQRTAKLAKKAAPTQSATEKKSLFNRQLLLGLAVHGALLAAAVLTHHWMFALAWVTGMAVVFPFFAAIRQVLEHRSFDARADVDHRATPHGAINRLFGSGPLASTMGAAGFNRHLLHHWDPQLSYTRFVELEAYLMQTDLGPALRTHQVSYVQTFSRLLRAP
jgi:fatty acid desaturase